MDAAAGEAIAWEEADARAALQLERTPMKRRKMYLLSIVESPMIRSDLVFIICNASSTSEWLGSSLDAFNAVWHGAAGDGKALHAL